MPQTSWGLIGESEMRVYKSEVKRNPYAQAVRVSRTKTGKWILDRGTRLSEVPANTFTCWDHAEWTANAWANQEYEQFLTEQE
jgi:hypothetical protein